MGLVPQPVAVDAALHRLCNFESGIHAGGSDGQGFGHGRDTAFV